MIRKQHLAIEIYKIVWISYKVVILLVFKQKVEI